MLIELGFLDYFARSSEIAGKSGGTMKEDTQQSAATRVEGGEIPGRQMSACTCRPVSEIYIRSDLLAESESTAADTRNIYGNIYVARTHEDTGLCNKRPVS